MSEPLAGQLHRLQKLARGGWADHQVRSTCFTMCFTWLLGAGTFEAAAGALVGPADVELGPRRLRGSGAIAQFVWQRQETEGSSKIFLKKHEEAAIGISGRRSRSSLASQKLLACSQVQMGPGGLPLLEVPWLSINVYPILSFQGKVKRTCATW